MDGSMTGGDRLVGTLSDAAAVITATLEKSGETRVTYVENDAGGDTMCIQS